MKETRILLDNIRSVHNVGSIFRTAECAGVSRIYCTETTPVPIDRFGRKRKDLAKVGLGSEDLVAWEHLATKSDVIECIKQLHKDGFEVVVVEQTANSRDISEFERGQKVVYILGNEVEGVSEFLIKLADTVIEIPMKGKKESLNVSVTAGIVLFNR
ncbi:MAG: TrmH family RNA methyltransferase [Candidatus Taylorbacteria bacterium]